MRTYVLRLKGGSGSGNFDHKGRLGEQGGSLPRTSGQQQEDSPGLKALIAFRDKKSGNAGREYKRAVQNIAYDIEESLRKRDAVGVLHNYRKMVSEYEKLKGQKFRESEIEALIEELQKRQFVRSRQ